MEWYVELFIFAEMLALLYCGLATMKFSGRPPFRSIPPTTPVKLEFVFRYEATPPRLPFAIFARVLENRRRAEEPLRPLTPTVPMPAKFSPLSILSKRGASPPSRVVWSASINPFSTIIGLLMLIIPVSFVPLVATYRTSNVRFRTNSR